MNQKAIQKKVQYAFFLPLKTYEPLAEVDIYV